MTAMQTEYAGAVRELAAQIRDVVSPQDCVAARELADGLRAEAELGRKAAAGQPRPRVVRLLNEAVIHLSRGGTAVPVDLARDLACLAMLEAAAMLEAGA